MQRVHERQILPCQMRQQLRLPCVAVGLLLLVLLQAGHGQVLGGFPIWSGNATTKFVLLRSPEFGLRAPPSSALVYFSALGTARSTAGTSQPKLLGACSLFINGVLVSIGPGHDVPTNSQVVRAVDIMPFIRGASNNTLGVASYFDRSGAPSGADITPRVQATLVVSDAQGTYNVSTTTTAWLAFAADAYFNPTGDAGISWYAFPNEYLNRNFYPRGWSEPGFSPAADWTPAIAQPPFLRHLYLELGPAPATLVRYACAVHRVNASRQILDYGQEFMGGVNLSFVNGTKGQRVTVTVAEELLPGGSGVRSPARTGNHWSSTWTLAGDPALDSGMTHHEFIQFRYAQIDGAPDTLTPSPSSAGAWVVQHPAGGTGRNPWEQWNVSREDACAVSVPAAEAFGTGTMAHSPLGSFSSSNSLLDAVFNFSAYTIVATSLDVNVDGQTRERDIDVVDALFNELGQFYVFSPGDTSIQRRTMLEIFTNDTDMWGQWYDFKAMSVRNAYEYVLYTGDVGAVPQLWSDNDLAIRADGGVYNSLQFESGLRYFNGSGNGLLHFPATGNTCGGSWACDPLVDWPTGTRDGYDCSAANSDDTARSSLGAMAYHGISSLASWIGKAQASARFEVMKATVLASLARLNIRREGAQAYFVDGAVGAPASHHAVHSTLYAISAGAVPVGDATLSSAIVAFLAQHGVAPSSCMMGRWWVTGLNLLGVTVPEASDLALGVLTAQSYPSWLDMMAQGATTTMEAWRPEDKGNLDWAHPWCASPSFTIPGTVLGVEPLTPGWATWRVAPRASDIISMDANVPTPGGMVSVSYRAQVNVGVGTSATLAVSVLPGQTAQACLAVPGAAAEVAGFSNPASDVVTVDGVAAATSPWGRFLCVTTQLTSGMHLVARVTTL